MVFKKECLAREFGLFDLLSKMNGARFKAFDKYQRLYHYLKEELNKNQNQNLFPSNIFASTIQKKFSHCTYE